MANDPLHPDDTALPVRKIQVKIPCPLIKRLEAEDKRRGGKQRSAIIVEAVETYLNSIDAFLEKLDKGEL